MSMRRRFATSVLLIAFLSPSPEVAADATRLPSVDLRPNYVEGQRMRYRVEHQNAIDVGGRKQKSTVTVDYALQWQRVTDDGAVLGVTYEAASLEISQGAQTSKYDSRTPDAEGMNPQIGQIIGLLVGKQLEVHFDRSGKVTKIDGLDELKAAGGGVLASFLDEAILMRTYSKWVTPAVGKEQAGVGEKWSVEEVTPLDNTSQLVAKLEVTLTEADAMTAKMAISGKARLDFKEDRDANVPKPALTKQAIKGTIVWDRPRRLVTSYETDFSFELRGKLPNGDETVVGMRQLSRTSYLAPAKEASKP